MAITIEAVTPATLTEVQAIDNAFTTTERVHLDAAGGEITLRYRPIPAFVKIYPAEECLAYLDTPGRALYLARLDGAPAGRLMLRSNWNGFAYIEDIAVAPEWRGQGIGRRLIEQAIAWAHAQGRPGIMLETSDVNAAACRFYARCGFALRGFDTALYRGSDAPLDEIALFWYLIF